MAVTERERWYSSPMAETTTEQSPSAWIQALPFETYFWARDVPGNRSTVRATLSALNAERRETGIERVAPGLYWRGFPKGVPWDPTRARIGWGETSALVYAGRGAGWAEWCAVNELGWAHQGSRYAKIAVVRRRLKPTLPCVRFVRRSNERRLELNWTEVSILEALALEMFMEYPLDLRLERLASGRSIAKVGCAGPVRLDRVAWAAETDDLATPDLLCSVRELRDLLPDEIWPPDWASPVKVWSDAA